jgi:hypothetical protein
VKKDKRKEKSPVIEVTDSWKLASGQCHVISLPFLAPQIDMPNETNCPKDYIWSPEKLHNLGTGLYNYLRTMAFSKASYLMLASS